ncbi:hypothetical protein Gogos_006938, partial [Gossypium gossypioides]|nr:hypothetical protein [Gossypium gossypioides]
VEALVLLEGLKLAWTKGYHQVEIESDNAILISIVRDNNKMVDCLTREAQGGMEELFIHVDPPIYVRNLLEDDSV